VLVVDEAQDMNADEYALVKALMEVNEEMRVILVGDDDQNIYEFREPTPDICNNYCRKRILLSMSSQKIIAARKYCSICQSMGCYYSATLKSQPVFASTNGNGIFLSHNIRAKISSYLFQLPFFRPVLRAAPAY
jgi:ATP-dependent DNA helicase RecQ